MGDFSYRETDHEILCLESPTAEIHYFIEKKKLDGPFPGSDWRLSNPWKILPVVC